ncbi:chemotaxis protein CheC [Tyzzerella sp. OttesenSCG-928-J15]|nr:chemotaxis protein CheC [Tyzzerella sp. OttesenSCG-928-J15]
MDEFKLNQIHFDVLREVGNIGAGNAVTSLSKMLDRKVDMSVPNVSMVDFADVSNFIGGPENLVAGILVNLGGDINGIMMFLTEEKYCVPLIQELFGNTGLFGEGEGLNEVVLSALKEVGNILAGAYLSSLADLIQKKISPSTPSICIDMAGAILSVPAIEFSKVADQVLLIESVFETMTMDISGYFILVPDFESFKTIFTSLGV